MAEDDDRLRAAFFDAQYRGAEMPDRAYALVTCPFNALQQLVTVDERLAALEAAHDALAPGGSFVFDVFVPGFEFICEAYGEWQTEAVTFRGREHEHRTRTRIVDEPRQVFEVVRTGAPAVWRWVTDQFCTLFATATLAASAAAAATASLGFDIATGATGPGRRNPYALSRALRRSCVSIFSVAPQ